MYKLVDSAHSAKDGPISDGNVTGNLGVIAHNYVVAHDTIMCQVAVSHQQAIFTNDGFFLFLGTPVYGHKLADCGVVANNYKGIFTFIFQILWNGRDYCPGENTAVLTYPGTFHNG